MGLADNVPSIGNTVTRHADHETLEPLDHRHLGACRGEAPSELPALAVVLMPAAGVITLAAGAAFPSCTHRSSLPTVRLNDGVTTRTLPPATAYVRHDASRSGRQFIHLRVLPAVTISSRS